MARTLLALLLAAPVAAAVPLLGFEALVPAPEAAALQGHLFASDGAVVEGVPRDVPRGPVLHADRLEVDLVEWEWVGLNHRPPSGPTTQMSTNERYAGRYVLEDATVHVASLGEAVWRVAPEAEQEILRLPDSTCEVRVPGSAEAPEKAPWLGPLVAQARGLRADCDSEHLKLRGPGQGQVFAMGLRIEGWRPGADRTGGAEVVSFETGARRSAVLGPLAQTHVLVRAELRWTGVDAVWEWTAPARHTVVADDLDMQGRLGLPDNATVWPGELRVADEPRWRASEGGFSFFAEGPHVRVRPNDPPSSAPSAPHGPRLAGPWAPWGIVAAASVVVWIARRFAFASLLFTRLTETSALQERRRRMVVEFLEHHPGASVQEAVEALGIPRGSLRHHLRILEAQRLVTRRRFGARTALFLTRGHGWTEQAKLAAGRRPSFARALSLLSSQGGLTQDELAQALSVSHSYAARVLRRLASFGLVAVRREGRRLRYEPLRPS